MMAQVTQQAEEKKEEPHIHDYQIQSVFQGETPTQETNLIALYTCSNSGCDAYLRWESYYLI